MSERMFSNVWHLTSDICCCALAQQHTRQRVGDVVSLVFMKTAHNTPVLAPAAGFEHEDEHRKQLCFYKLMVECLCFSLYVQSICQDVMSPDSLHRAMACVA